MKTRKSILKSSKYCFLIPKSRPFQFQLPSFLDFLRAPSNEGCFYKYPKLEIGLDTTRHFHHVTIIIVARQIRDPRGSSYIPNPITAIPFTPQHSVIVNLRHQIVIRMMKVICLYLCWKNYRSTSRKQLTHGQS